MKVFGKVLLRVFASALLVGLLALFLAFCALVCFEQPVPRALLDRVLTRLSTADYLVRADAATFRFPRRLCVRNLRVLDRGRHYGPKTGPAVTVMSASQVDIALDLRRLPWSRATILRGVTLVDFRYPRLPMGYYIPDSVEFPGQPDFREVDEPLKLDLPELRPFRVRLVRPEILGIAAPLVEIPFVEVTRDGLRVREASLRWPDTDVPMTVAGHVTLDLNDQWMHGVVGGQARQHNIRPLLVALDITNSYQFIDAFTKVEKPVDVTCTFDVNLRNNDLRILLDLHPQGGRHHGVPLKRVDGKVDIRVFVRDTYQNARVTVGPLAGALADGSAVEGTLVYENTNDVGFVDFDVGTRAPLRDVLAIADVMNDGTLDGLAVTNGVPTVTLNGHLAVDPAHAAQNDLRGTLAFAQGSLFGVPLRDASAAFRVEGTTVTFTNAAARGPQGGRVEGGGVIAVPESRRDLATFGIDLTGESLALSDLAQIFGIDEGERRGLVSGRVALAGPLETNAVARLAGSGRLVCRDGHLAQMKLFAGLTDYFAKHVPGVSELVNLSDGALDFTLTNGVFAVSNAVVSGRFLSVRAEGAYDLVQDRLDVRARVALTKNDTLLGKLATPITWPFSNLAQVLLDFGIQGPLGDPVWTYARNPLGLLPIGKTPAKR